MELYHAAWQVINRCPAQPLVQDQGQVYGITLLWPNHSDIRPRGPQETRCRRCGYPAIAPRDYLA